MPRYAAVILLIVVLFAVLPTWPYSRNWGYYPVGGIGFILVLTAILLLSGLF